MTEDGRLLAFALGTFHAVLLTLALVLLLYLTVDLGSALDGLSTAAGLAVFGALWVTSVYCTHRGMRDAELRPGGPVYARSILRNGETWGAWNGVLFFWCLLAAGITLLLVQAVGDIGEATSVSGYGFSREGQPDVRVSTREEGSDAIAGVLVFGVIAFGAGTIVSALVGAFFGFVFALVDLQLLWLARRLSGAREPREVADAM